MHYTAVMYTSMGTTWHIVCRYDYENENYDEQHQSFGNSERVFCQPYQGDACSGYIGNDIVYVTERIGLSQVEESLRGRPI